MTFFLHKTNSEKSVLSKTKRRERCRRLWDLGARRSSRSRLVSAGIKRDVCRSDVISLVAPVQSPAGSDRKYPAHAFHSAFESPPRESGHARSHLVFPLCGFPDTNSFGVFFFCFIFFLWFSFSPSRHARGSPWS